MTDDGAVIFHSEHAAETLARRAEIGTSPTIRLSRDEVKEMATQFARVAAIAKAHHMHRLAA